MKPPTCAVLLPFFASQLCKMPLVVRPIEHANVPQCVAVRIATLGSLVIGRPPPYAGYQQEQEASVKFDLENKPYVHHLKVVDPDDEQQVLAYAKWEVYPDGRPDLDKLSQPMDPEDMTIDQFGLLREAAHKYFCQRNGEMGKHPHILLALLVTDSKYRRLGAGSLLVKWGIELSEKLGLPCYLQASEQGRRLYRHHGFEDIDTVVYQLSDYGLEGTEVMTEMIRKPLGRSEMGGDSAHPASGDEKVHHETKVEIAHAETDDETGQPEGEDSTVE